MPVDVRFVYFLLILNKFYLVFGSVCLLFVLYYRYIDFNKYINLSLVLEL